MITKDEEHCLRNCLRSVCDLADEIVIVDTGSSDRTVEIAREFGARVRHLKWVDDFSAARNASLEMARGEWILSLDADEEIALEDHANINLLLREVEVDALQVTTRNYCGRVTAPDFHPDDDSYPGRCRSAPGWVPSTKVRLWRRSTGLRWQNRIHELLEPSALAQGVELGRTRIPVHHYGLLIENQEKLDYYFDLAMQAVAENPEDSKAHLEVALVLAQRSELDRALPYFERSAELSSNPAKALAHAASALFAKARFGAAGETARRAVAADPECAPALHITALVEHFQNGDDQRAIELLRRVIEIGPHYALAHFNLARCLRASGRHAEALRSIRTARKIAPHHLSIRELHAAILLELNRPREALDLLPEPLLRDSENWELWNRRGTALARMQDFGGAVEAFAFAAEFAPDETPEPLRNRDAVDAWARGDAIGCRGAQRPGITLCMIVRDEEQNLPRCLNSVADLFDQIVIVDTGSVDQTVAIARDHGAEVHHFPWRNDFAAARNVSLAHAECRWIIWLDADDTLPAESRGILRRLADEARPPAGIMITARMLRADSLASETRQLRIFPNQPGIAFTGIIHEQLGPSLLRLAFPLIDATEIIVEHHGYAESTAVRSKAERNLPLLIAAAAEPDATHHERYNLIRGYFGAGQAAEALPTIEAVLQDPVCARESPGILNQARVYMARILLAQKDPVGASRLLRHTLEADPDDPVALYHLGCAERDRNNWGAARDAFVKASQSRGTISDDLGTPLKVVRYRAQVDHAELLLNGGDPAAAIEIARAAREATPEHGDAWLVEARAIRSQRRDPAAADLLAMAIEHCGPDPRLSLLLGNIQFEAGEIEQALDTYQRVPAPTAAIQANHGKALVLLGRDHEALPRLEAALAADPELLDVQCIIGDLHFRHTRPEQALQAYEGALRAGLPPSATTFSRIGDTYRAMGHDAAARLAYETALRLDPKCSRAQLQLQRA
jgi:glycosyltransferase involved in cell wall biosynthesis/lipopolysaccharide biosynthesis regulator YciM